MMGPAGTRSTRSRETRRPSSLIRGRTRSILELVYAIRMRTELPGRARKKTSRRSRRTAAPLLLQYVPRISTAISSRGAAAGQLATRRPHLLLTGRHRRGRVVGPRGVEPAEPEAWSASNPRRYHRPAAAPCRRRRRACCTQRATPRTLRCCHTGRSVPRAVAALRPADQRQNSWPSSYWDPGLWPCTAVMRRRSAPGRGRARGPAAAGAPQQESWATLSDAATWYNSQPGARHAAHGTGTDRLCQGPRSRRRHRSLPTATGIRFDKGRGTGTDGARLRDLQWY